MSRLAYLLAAIVVAIAALFAGDALFPTQSARLAVKAERSLAGLEPKHLQIPGFEIAYLEGGQGEPLVLLHGIGADKDNFTRVSRYLTSHVHVYAMDLPGFGESSKPSGAGYRIEDQVRYVDQIVQQLGLDRFHLGGSSMGGWIAGVYTAAHPLKVDSLWLLDPGGVAGAKLSEVRSRLARGEESGLFARTPQDFDRVLDLVFVHRPFIPHGVKHVLAERAAVNYALHTRILHELQVNPPNLEELLNGNPTPALIVWGAQDRVLDPSAAEILKSAMPNAQVTIMPGIGHLPMIEAPRQSARDYLRFREGLKRD